MVTADIPFNRWGLISAPVEAAGSYLLVEGEGPEEWTEPPPSDAVRIWVRRPGAPAGDDRHNWTVWVHERDLGTYLSDYEITEWLKLGVEPAWH